MEATRVVEILRRCRHDFGNHLQVVSGYTELGQSNKVKAYIESLVKKMAQERIIFESVSAEAALYFYEQVLLADDLGVILVYKDLQIKNWQVLQDSMEPVRSLAPLAAAVSREDDPVVYVSLIEDGLGTDIIFTSPYFEKNPVSFRLNWE